MNRKIFHGVLLSSMVLLLGSCSTGQPTDSRSEAANRPIKIGGSSEVYDVLELLTDAYSAQTEGITFEFFPPSQTSGGIEGVSNKTMDIGGVSRDITAEESGTALTHLPLVETALVMVVHESVTGVTNISADQIKAIYQGDLTNWQQLGGPDAPIVLLDFTEDENEKQVLRRAYLGADLKITPDAIIFSEDDELMDTLGNTNFSIGAVPFEEELAALPVTVLSIDGVAPSLANLQSGAYTMTLPLGIVLPQDPAPEVQAFIEFATSSEGQKILTAADYVVTSQ